ncbi:PQQ-binding-like beta-propeller repeat protein [Tessaracoccus oleiagri]|uniref:Pyrrolo-quinoline quinone repeat domain-containing protein n=1 Tax=Tessaracoccus oleiagri TaxID=686624 RepID=A0A1G9KXT5_9ACTN|nr:PQQ-binding-like beta-propeller repeat protein [Tessaracoccus oleiagri]SDL54521.1 hypothetical protein SAMN04488242_1884 [Tessaracoccus oleiagri]
MNSELSPFQRGGQDLPVTFVAPVPSRAGDAIDLDAAVDRSRGRRRGITAAVAVLVLAVLAGQWVLRPPQADWLEAGLVVGLEQPPPAMASVHAFGRVGGMELTARVSLGGRTVQVRSVTNEGRTTLWEREVGADRPIGAVSLVGNAADRRALLVLSTPRTLAPGAEDERDVVVALNLDDGRELSRRDWDPAHRLVPSDDGRIYRLDTGTSEIQAMQDINSVSWRTTIDPYMWLGHAPELRRHGGWLLLVPEDEGRRATMRGGDVFLTALDPATGAIPGWLAVAGPGERFQRQALEDLFVEHSVGAGERVVRARRWSDGAVRWQRFDAGLIPLAVDGKLYATSSTLEGTRLMRLDPADGGLLWERELEGTMTLLLGGDEGLVAVTPDRWAITVLDEDSGEVRAELPYEGAPHLGTGSYFSAGLSPAGDLVLSRRGLGDGALEWRETYRGFRAVTQVGPRLLLVAPEEQRLSPLYPP